MEALLSVMCLFLALVWHLLCCIVVLPFFAFWPKVGFAIHQLCALGWLFLLGIRVTYLDIEKVPDKGIIAPNHASMFDIFVLAASPLRFVWISKKEISYIPINGWAMKLMGCYFLSRDRSGKDLKVMEEVEKGLRKGKKVVIFPEGTRTRTGELLPMKKGAFRTAQNAGVPLCPVGISGTFEIAPKGQLPKKRGIHVKVKFGDPMWVPPNEPLEPHMEKFRNQMLQLINSAKVSPC
jgi:1-acyl-sn-glycerol-3-phosphate acyltransferase